MKSRTSKSEDTAAVVKLLQRNWFSRVWILQEVAASRQILIICHSSEMDGFAFCQGLIHMNLNALDKITMTRALSAVSLIKSAALRPKRALHTSEGFSLRIHGLGELIDSYHIQNATDRRDKVYALLGMSTDTFPRLAPDYRMSWESLFSRLVRTFVPEAASVLTWNSEAALIETKGCFLGVVHSVRAEKESPWGETQTLSVNLQDVPGLQRAWEGDWTIKTSAKRAEPGDYICALRGASRPTIVRIYDDYCLIIAMAIEQPAVSHDGPLEVHYGDARSSPSPDRRFSFGSDQSRASDLIFMEGSQTECSMIEDERSGANKGNSSEKELRSDEETYAGESSDERSRDGYFEPPNPSQDGTRSDANFRLVWDLEASPNDTGTEAKLNEFLRNRAIEYEAPEERFGLKEVAVLLLTMDDRHGHSCASAGRRLWSALQILWKASPFDSVEALSVMEYLVSVHRELHESSWVTAVQELATMAVNRRSYTPTEANIIHFVSLESTELKDTSATVALDLLLNTQQVHVLITENILKAAAANSHNGDDVMSLLLDRGGEIIIGETVVEAAMENKTLGEKVLKVLLERKKDYIATTETLARVEASLDEIDRLRPLIKKKKASYMYPMWDDSD